ncbi:ubiquinol-cytochrome-c reductase complex assembly factor 2 [Egretta garzetta]|uniref:ubiquinol-cytochrome-c reductase complex assembly factor 2 n=1 Tax=Egretta garzetta TaxID=188379 RepID=UPI00163D136E|nr:ubiquinol-cytochrome-c reductase complex assembly factor 2 [Egretta garzetta]
MCLVILVGQAGEKWKGKKMICSLEQHLFDTFIPFQIADPETCDRMYESLVRIHTNYYKNKYPRLKDTSFTGLTVEDCKMILATDVLKQMEDMKKGTWKKLREKFYAKKPEEDSK